MSTFAGSVPFGFLCFQMFSPFCCFSFPGQKISPGPVTLIPGPWLGETTLSHPPADYGSLPCTFWHNNVIEVGGRARPDPDQGPWRGRTPCLCQTTYRRHSHVAAVAPQPPGLRPLPSSVSSAVIVLPLALLFGNRVHGHWLSLWAWALARQ